MSPAAASGSTDPSEAPQGPRLLFLDDDPLRAAAFLTGRPNAVWVQTSAECLVLLAEAWDEVHLDHDLGGETFVSSDREDCGMAVVRWLCEHPRPHLKAARFVVHTHNPDAACMMVLHLQVAGFDVQARPFGVELPEPPAAPALMAQATRPRIRRFIDWLRGRRGAGT